MYNFNLIDESKPCFKILIMIQQDKSKDQKETRREKWNWNKSQTGWL